MAAAVTARFLELPREIRDLIYEQLLLETDEHHIDFDETIRKGLSQTYGLEYLQDMVGSKHLEHKQFTCLPFITADHLTARLGLEMTCHQIRAELTEIIARIERLEGAQFQLDLYLHGQLVQPIWVQMPSSLQQCREIRIGVHMPPDNWRVDKIVRERSRILNWHHHETLLSLVYKCVRLLKTRHAAEIPHWTLSVDFVSTSVLDRSMFYSHSGEAYDEDETFPLCENKAWSWFLVDELSQRGQQMTLEYLHRELPRHQKSQLTHFEDQFSSILGQFNEDRAAIGTVPDPVQLFLSGQKSTWRPRMAPHRIYGRITSYGDVFQYLKED